MENHANAIRIVDDWLRIAYPEAIRANSWQLDKSGFARSSIGWRIQLKHHVSLLIAVDQLFPYSKPAAVFFGPGAPKVGPHIEDNGCLCLVTSDLTTDSLDPAGIFAYFIDKASRLLELLDRDELLEDYVIDFGAYWSRSRTTGRSVQILFDLAPPTRPLFLGTYRSQRIVSDDEKRLRRWLLHRVGEAYKDDFEHSIFVWLKTLPEPSAYPETYRDLRTLIDGAEGAPLLDDVISGNEAGGVMVIGGASSPGRTSGGAIIFSAAQERHSNKGFRPGKMPAASRNISLKIDRASVIPVDAAATRIPLTQLNAAGAAHIAILGCGSLGAGATMLLAQQGIKSFSLFDPDSLGWENIGRHALGAREVGTNKADALKAKILSDLPDTEAIASYAKDWRLVLAEDSSLFDGVSLIISATGDWGSNAALSDLQAKGGIKSPVIYTWLERNAIAAHVVVLQGTKSSLRSGFDNTGRPLTMAASWWSEDQDPRCGGAASPYGAIDLAAGQSLVARAALDIASGSADAPLWRVWVGLSSDLEKAGGFWSSAFRSVVGDPAEGGKMMAAHW